MKVKRLRLLLRVSAVSVMALCGGSLGAWGGTPVNFGSVNVGSSTTATVTVTFQSAGTLGSISVLTQGATAQDFTNAGGGTCATGNAYAGGAACTVIVTFTPKYAGTRYGGVLLEDGSGNELATGYVYGTGTGPQVIFTPGTQSVSGIGLNAPDGVAVDGSGNIFVADFAYNNPTIQEIPVGCASLYCIQTLGGGFSRLSGIAVDGSGNVFVTDYDNSAVKEISPGCTSSTCVLTLGGGFFYPEGVAVDGSGNVFVADNSNSTVNEIPLGCTSSSCVTLLGGGFKLPTGVAVDGNGNVYVADSVNDAVKKIPLGCVSSSCVVTLGGGFGNPAGVAVDGNGNVFVADSSDQAVKEIPFGCASSACVQTLGTGFSNPWAVAVDGHGNIFIANAGNNTVDKLDFADPPSLTFASTSVGSTSSDSPQTVTVENIGNATLNFSIPSTGNNPAIAANFTLDSSGTTVCPLLTANSSTAGTLAAGASCLLPISFEPTTAGTLTGSLILTDNNLNATGPRYTTQNIMLSGTGIGKTTPNVSVTPASSSITTAQALTVTVAVSGTPTPTGSVILSGGGYTSTATTLSSGSAIRSIFLPDRSPRAAIR